MRKALSSLAVSLEHTHPSKQRLRWDSGEAQLDGNVLGAQRTLLGAQASPLTSHLEAFASRGSAAALHRLHFALITA